MRNVIQQTVVLPASAETLYQMYLDPKEHEAVTGDPVTIAAQSGAPFSAFGGALSGTMLAFDPHNTIVQSWRSRQFHESDPDSTLGRYVADDAAGGRIHLIHLDVPDHDYEGVTEGWQRYYWTPWKAYLESKTP